MSYTTAAIIREIDDVFNNDDGQSVYTDAELTNWCDIYAQPIIDSRLEARGFTVPITTPGSLIKLIAALYTVRMAFGGFIAAFSGRDTERAKALKAEADGLLNDICNGRRTIGIDPDAESNEIEYDDEPEVRPDHETFVGDFESWQPNTIESREGD